MGASTARILRSLASAIIITGGLAACAASAPPAQAADAAQRVIVVSGEGMAEGTPNQATLSGGVVTQAPTAAAALGANSTAMNKVFATLKAAGIPDNKIQTSNFSVSPQYPPYRQDNPEPQRIIGYQVSNQVTVVVTDLAKLGTTLDALVRSGANSVGGINFSIADPKPLEEKARRDAVADAIAKAKTLASAAGVTLGPVQSIQEGVSQRPVPMYALRANLAAAPETPVAAGTQEVTISVSITYAIQ